MYPIGSICKVWVSNEINKAKATRRAQTICHTKNYTKVIIPLMGDEYKGARLNVKVLECHKFHVVAEVVDVIGLKRPKFDENVKIHKSSTGSKISFTKDEVKSNHESSSSKSVTSSKEENPNTAMYTDGPMKKITEEVKDGHYCGGNSEGGDCCGSDQKSNGGDCCGSSITGNGNEAEGSCGCAQPTFDELLEQEEKYKAETATATASENLPKMESSSNKDSKNVNRNSSRIPEKDPQHHAISMKLLTHVFIPTIIALLLMKLGMMVR